MAATTTPPRPRSKALKANKRRFSGLSTSSVILFLVVGLVALGIVGYAGWKVWDVTKPFGQQRAQDIDGVTNYRVTDKKMLTQRHVEGAVKYKVSPPVGGEHNTAWENCMGDIYAAQIPNEHAVHSLEHGAVWVTYNPDTVSKANVDKLAEKVQGRDFMLMSPYPGLKSPISLQAWGFQLKLDNVDDPRLDKFITAFRKAAGVEDAPCSGGVTITGTTPQAAAGMPQP